MAPCPSSASRPGPVLLVIIDGLGLSPEIEGNALRAAETPTLCRVDRNYIGGRLGASGPAVGLAPGEMGNSNVGHLHIGAGRSVPQDGPRIDAAIEDGSLFDNESLSNLMDAVRSGGGTLHLLGLVSDGRVHSDLDHLLALLTMARRRAVGRVAVHAFLDGRDVSPGTASQYLERLEADLARSPDHRLATISGRYYAMDRDRRWDRLDAALAAILRGEGRIAGGTIEAMEGWVAAGESDEFVRPTVLGGYTGVEPGDAFITFNYRADRMRQMVRALLGMGGQAVDTAPLEGPARLVTMTRYDPQFRCAAAFEPPEIPMSLGEAVSRAGITQLRLAETEKYAHVTYFLNGGREDPFPGEERILVSSPPVPTYDLMPQMSAPEVTDRLVDALEAGRHGLMIVNYANPDMVGHTGDFDAAVQAVEAVDAGLKDVLEALEEAAGIALIISDHGNVEKMVNDRGAHTAHTVREVPCFVVGEAYLRDGPWSIRENGTLIDVAPTVLELLGVEVPDPMEGRNLLVSADAVEDVARGEVLDGCGE